jgi:N6-L-threonylcarbamoyladenine synthase
LNIMMHAQSAAGPVRILAIESSCDEAAAAVIEDGHRILSSVVASQIAIHSTYGGVVPEVASRQHLRTLLPVVEQALREAGIGWESIDAVAATYGPGLAGSLLVGLSAAKGLAYARRKPLLGINHLEGHIYANWLDAEGEVEPPPFPALCLVVSGGHTDLVLMRAHGQFERLGRTVDDAAGEAYDKVARLLGLGFPGGPAIDRAAREHGPARIQLPRAWLPGTWNFSFSGLKTAVLHLTREEQPPSVAKIAAAFQEAVVDVLVTKTVRAAEEYDARVILLAGGVAANSALRQEFARRATTPVRVPPPQYCTDNAAMIGAAAYFHYIAGECSDFTLDVRPGLPLAS